MPICPPVPRSLGAVAVACSAPVVAPPRFWVDDLLQQEYRRRAGVGAVEEKSVCCGRRGSASVLVRSCVVAGLRAGYLGDLCKMCSPE